VTGEPLTPSGVSLMITKLAKAAGVKLSMKQLRKGFGTRHAGRVPAQVLQRLMRHANISTTTDFYANVDAAAEEAIPGPLRNSSGNTEGKPVQGDAGRADATAEPRTDFD
jgi:integrase